MNSDFCPEVTIIIPVYNVEKYLPACIDSVINQSFKNIEIVLVDDGSTDNCAEICDIYSKKDDRIIVKHQKNSGPAFARYSGMKIARGEYVAFVDSDDYIEADMIENMLAFIKKHNLDIVICNDVSVDEKTKKRNFRKWPEKDFIMDKDSALKYLAEDKIKSFFCNKIFRKNILTKDDFQKKVRFEDYMCMHEIFFRCQKIGFLKNAYYNYLRRESGSITKNDDIEYYFLKACLVRFYWFENFYKKYSDSAFARCIPVALTYLKLKDKKEQYESECLNFLKMYFKRLLKSKNISIKDKIKVIYYIYR